MKTSESIPTGKRSKWPAEVEPLPGATRRAANPPAHTQQAASESQEHTQPSAETENAPADTDPEAHRIAGELVKLHQDGAIKCDEDASFYANLVKTFGATYTASTSPDEATLTDEQLVPPPPGGLSAEERAAYYQEDLEHAIGEEFIDHDPQPAAWPPEARAGRNRRNSGRGKRNQ